MGDPARSLESKRDRSTTLKEWTEEGRELESRTDGGGKFEVCVCVGSGIRTGGARLLPLNLMKYILYILNQFRARGEGPI